MGRDNQERIHRYCGGDTCDFINCSPRALLTGAGDKNLFTCQALSSCLNYLEVLPLIEIHALARGTKRHIAANRSLVPLLYVGPETVQIEIATRCKGSGERQQDAAEAVRKCGKDGELITRLVVLFQTEEL